MTHIERISESDVVTNNLPTRPQAASYSGRIHSYSGRIHRYSGRIPGYSGRILGYSGRIPGYSGRIPSCSIVPLTDYTTSPPSPSGYAGR